MPIVQCAGRYVYYAHVPKCAGTAVEDYLAGRFGPLKLLDRRWQAIPETERWARSSPQHMPIAMLRSLFPDDAFAAHFAVVRHPARRLVSAFLHNRNHRQINPLIGLRRFVAGLEGADRDFHERTDNHFLPAVRFIHDEARIFRLEDGDGALVSWLDDLAGNSDGPRALPRVNEKSAPAAGARVPRKWRILLRFRPPLPDLDRPLLEKIHAFYREDYERFGYDPHRP